MNAAEVPLTAMLLPVNPLNVNSGHITTAVCSMAQKLAISAQQKTCDVASLSNLCISLSRVIDFAVAINAVPTQVSELATNLKLACLRKSESSLQAPLAVLMVTVKNACSAQWFSSKESQELLALADEVVSYFCTPEGFSSGQADIIPTVSQIISRYYPWLKLGHILASVSIKPGFEACALDFHVSKTTCQTEMDKVRLLVAVKDNIETSSCIMNPPKANILLNGVGVQGRTVGRMYLGPQVPTIVGSLLTYETNLLQAIGHFDAHYIMLIASMSVIPLSDLPAVHDHVQPPTVALDTDAEIVEGPSKINLNCPISFTRIRQPVKGHLCKHLQCYDLSNYIEINTKRPTWRCPLCNQPVCYPDIRIDKKMLKILQEVDAGVTDVFIHSDGSWEANIGQDNHNDELHANVFKGLPSEQQQPSGLLIGPSNVFDLTDENNDTMVLDFSAPEDSKAAIQLDLQNRSVHSADPSATQILGNSLPVFTDSVSPASNREQQAFLGNNQQSYTPAPFHPPANNLQLQQLQFGQMLIPGYDWCTIPGNVSRTPTFQGSVVQNPNSSPLQSCGSSFMNNLPRNTSSLPLQTPFHEMNNLPQNNPSISLHTSLPSVTVSNSTGTLQRDSLQQQYIQALLNQSYSTQMRGLIVPVQVSSNGFRATPGLEAPRQLQPSVNNMTPPQMANTPPHLRPRTQLPVIGSMSNINQNVGTSQRFPHMGSFTQPTRTGHVQQMTAIQMQASMPAAMPSGSGGTIRVSRPEDLMNVQNEQNWQPARRMRGSITGRGYYDARDAFMIRPTQTTAAPSNQANMSHQLQVLLANRNLMSSQPNVSQNN